VRRAVVAVAGVTALALVPLAAGALGSAFYVTLVGRIMIWAIAALALNLILGYGGMVSFGHAAYIGVVVYTVAILSAHGVDSGYVQWPLAVALAAGVATVVGTISLRTSGVYFIMITLAFAQMLYFLGVSLKTYGGDDGMTLPGRSRLPGLVDLEGTTTLYYVILAVLVVLHLGLRRLVASRLGAVIQGVASNERRMRALGFDTFRFKLAAFVISGVMCAVAGILLVNFTRYASPAFMHWTRSGDLLVMVIFGGMGTVLGPVLGAFAFLLLEEVLKGYTEYWPVLLGPLLVLVVLGGKRGIHGLVLGAPSRG